MGLQIWTEKVVVQAIWVLQASDGLYCTFPPVAIATRVTWSRDVNVTLFAAVGSELQANDEASSDITMSGVLAILTPAAA